MNLFVNGPTRLLPGHGLIGWTRKTFRWLDEIQYLKDRQEPDMVLMRAVEGGGRWSAIKFTKFWIDPQMDRKFDHSEVRSFYFFRSLYHDWDRLPSIFSEVKYWQCHVLVEVYQLTINLDPRLSNGGDVLVWKDSGGVVGFSNGVLKSGSTSDVRALWVRIGRLKKVRSLHSPCCLFPLRWVLWVPYYRLMDTHKTKGKPTRLRHDFLLTWLSHRWKP